MFFKYFAMFRADGALKYEENKHSRRELLEAYRTQSETSLQNMERVD